MKKYSLILLATMLGGASANALAHGEDLRAGNGSHLEPRVGAMSEEVVREKFKSYGMEINSLEHNNGVYRVQTTGKGGPAVVDVDASTGLMKSEGKRIRPQVEPDDTPLVVKPDPQRVPWAQRAIRFEKVGEEGLRTPTDPATAPR